MEPPNGRTFLLTLLMQSRQRGFDATHWEFSRDDEVRLFEFIHPSVNTRDGAFRLFNLPTRWDARTSALIGAEGEPVTFDLGARVQTGGPGKTDANEAKWIRQGASPDAAKKAASIEAGGGKVDWSYGHPYDATEGYVG